MDQAVQFEGILPCNSPDGARLVSWLPPGAGSLEVSLLVALFRLANRLHTALERGDRKTAVEIAYDTLHRLCSEVGERYSGPVPPGQVRIHSLWIDLEPLPAAARADGTLTENALVVRASYRHWNTAQARADLLAQAQTWMIV